MQLTHSLKGPGFNLCTLHVISWFQSFSWFQAFAFKLNLYRYAVTGLNNNEFQVVRGRELNAVGGLYEEDAVEVECSSPIARVKAPA
jgi:hypothetical protein